MKQVNGGLTHRFFLVLIWFIVGSVVLRLGGWMFTAETLTLGQLFALKLQGGIVNSMFILSSSEGLLFHGAGNNWYGIILVDNPPISINFVNWMILGFGITSYYRAIKYAIFGPEPEYVEEDDEDEDNVK